MKGEKRPRLPRRDVHDMVVMLRKRRKRKVVRARRMEVFSSAVRVERKSMKAVAASLKVSCQVTGGGGVEFTRETLNRDSRVLVACARAAVRLFAAASPSSLEEVLYNESQK